MFHCGTLEAAEITIIAFEAFDQQVLFLVVSSQIGIIAHCQSTLRAENFRITRRLFHVNSADMER